MSPVYCIISSKWKTTGQTVTKSSIIRNSCKFIIRVCTYSQLTKPPNPNPSAIINEDQKLTPTKTEMKVRVVLALTSLTAYYVADVDFDG